MQRHHTAQGQSIVFEKLGKTRKIGSADSTGDMESPAKPVVYEFGEFQLDTSHRRIVHTSSGAQLLTPRLYQILVALLESPGEIVAKEELIARVWKGQFVEEGNLSR